MEISIQTEEIQPGDVISGWGPRHDRNATVLSVKRYFDSVRVITDAFPSVNQYKKGRTITVNRG